MAPFISYHATQKSLKQILAFLNLNQHIYKLSVHFIYSVLSILESHDQNSSANFWPCQPKKVLINF